VPWGPLAAPNYGYVRNSHRPAGHAMRPAPGARQASAWHYVAERPPEEPGTERDTARQAARRARLALRL